MKRILIVLIHDDIKYVSDRSLRDLLKQLSKTVRRAQLKEIERLIESVKLDQRQSQALLDFIKDQGETVPVYYLNKITKGSLEAAFVIGAAFFGPIVTDLVKKVITDLATQNKLYKTLLKYVEGDRPETFAASLKTELSGGFRSGRFETEDITINETKNRIIINVELSTPLEFEDKLPEEYDEVRVTTLLRKLIQQNSARLA